ncbi:hypothetical protein HMI54_011969 [Coelomomyces lativittatus]|nr:hypothetical protein HMI54_011969 [Coelomomyces lativittatus]
MSRKAENEIKKIGLLITSKEDMLETLLQSRENGNVLGILSSSLGTGMFLYQVKEIWSDEDENDFIIVLKKSEFTVNTEPLVLYLNEIQSICTFRVGEN